MANIFQTLYNSIFSAKNQESISKTDDAYHSLLNIYNEKSFADFSLSEVIDISSVLNKEDAQKLISLYKVVDQPFLNYEKEVIQSVIALEVGEMLEREGKFNLGVVYSDMDRAGYDVNEVRTVSEMVHTDFDKFSNVINRLSQNDDIIIFLDSIRKSGSIAPSDLENGDIYQVANDYFKNELVDTFLQKDCIRYKAGVILEEMGVLPTGTTINDFKGYGAPLDLVKKHIMDYSLQDNTRKVINQIHKDIKSLPLADIDLPTSELGQEKVQLVKPDLSQFPFSDLSEESRQSLIDQIENHEKAISTYTAVKNEVRPYYEKNNILYDGIRVLDNSITNLEKLKDYVLNNIPENAFLLRNKVQSVQNVRLNLNIDKLSDQLPLSIKEKLSERSASLSNELNEEMQALGKKYNLSGIENIAVFNDLCKEIKYQKAAIEIIGDEIKKVVDCCNRIEGSCLPEYLGEENQLKNTFFKNVLPQYEELAFNTKEGLIINNDYTFFYMSEKNNTNRKIRDFANSLPIDMPYNVKQDLMFLASDFNGCSIKPDLQNDMKLLDTISLQALRLYKSTDFYKGSDQSHKSAIDMELDSRSNIIDLQNRRQEYDRVESFVDKLPVNMPKDIAKELVDIYSQIVVSELDHAYRDTFDLTSAKNWSDFIPSLSDKAINYQGLSDLIGKEYDETISNEINQRSLSVAEMKENRLNESEINLLTEISRSGLYFDADIKDDNKQIVERYFAHDYKEQISAFAEDNFKLIGEIQGLMRLNAGELLEANGLKPEGSTAAELKEEGYNVELLTLDVKTNPLDKVFCEAVTKEDYSLLVGLHSNNYVPSEEVMKSLKKEGVTENTMIAVEQILGLKDQGKSLNDLHLEQTHDHGEGKAMGSTVNELFNNL